MPIGESREPHVRERAEEGAMSITERIDAITSVSGRYAATVLPPPRAVPLPPPSSLQLGSVKKGAVCLGAGCLGAGTG